MNAGYSKSSGPDWCAVFRTPTQTTWATIDAEKATQIQQQSQQTLQSQQIQQSQRKDRVKIIVSQDTKSPKTQ